MKERLGSVSGREISLAAESRTIPEPLRSLRPGRDSVAIGSHSTSFVRRGPVAVLAACGCAFAINACAASPYVVPTASMSPSLAPGDRIVVNRIVYRLRPPRRGDVVVFRTTPLLSRVCEQAPRSVNVKRVVGVPGDRVSIRHGIIFVNGRAHRDGTHVPPTQSSFRFPIVPSRHVLVLGDNVNESCDAAYVVLNARQLNQPQDQQLFVPFESIIGQAEMVYWPPSRIHAIG